MMEEVKKRGGKREGAGRPLLYKDRLSVKLSVQQHKALEHFAKCLCTSKSELIETLITQYLASDNTDIVFCKKCGAPIVWPGATEWPSGECEIDCEHCGANYLFDYFNDKLELTS